LNEAGEKVGKVGLHYSWGWFGGHCSSQSLVGKQL
jgi:hypothetical protein